MKNKTVNIVLPMAGRGSRFLQAGYPVPKPLIPVHGIPMIELVVANVRPRQPHRFIFLVLEEHLRNFKTADLLNKIAPGCTIIPVPGVTEGAACTVLLARQVIATDEPMMICNSDQWVDIDINDYLMTLEKDQADGLIMTMSANHPKWSYVGFDANHRVTRVVEKEVISDEATVGIYNFRHGCDFVRAADEMIHRNIRVNNEFYVAPVYNVLIERGARITVHNIGAEGQGMHGLGIPADLDAFLQNPISKKAVSLAQRSRR